MEKIWLITDTHFYHDRIIELAHRPKNYHELIINNWKWLVNEDDTVIHLGDIIFHKHKKLKDILNDLPGNKILVRGNHDTESCGWYMRNGFQFACDRFEMSKILFTHIQVPEKYGFGCNINIHGHCHIPNRNNYTIKHANFNRLLSLEIEAYAPIELNRFIKKSTKESYYTEFKEGD